MELIQRAGLRWGAGLRSVLIATFAVALLAGTGIQWRAHRLAPTNGLDDVLYWSELGQWLARNTPEARIAATTIGAIGYFSKLHVYDMVGLTQPEVSKAGTNLPAQFIRRNYIGHERHNTAWIVAQQPDVLVFERDNPEPWPDIQSTRANYFAEWELLQEVKSGRLPYALLSPEILPGRYALLFVSPAMMERMGLSPPPSPESDTR